MESIEKTIEYFEGKKKFDVAITVAREAGMTQRMLESYQKGRAFYEKQIENYIEQRNLKRMNQIMEDDCNLANIDYFGADPKIYQGLQAMVEATGMTQEELKTI